MASVTEFKAIEFSKSIADAPNLLLIDLFILADCFIFDGLYETPSLKYFDFILCKFFSKFLRYPLGNSGTSDTLFTNSIFVLSISTTNIPSLKVKSLISKKSSV